MKDGEYVFRLMPSRRTFYFDNFIVLHLQILSFIMTSQSRRFNQLRVLTWDTEEDQFSLSSSKSENEPLQITTDAILPFEEHRHITVKSIQNDNIVEDFGRDDFDMEKQIKDVNKQLRNIDE